MTKINFADKFDEIEKFALSGQKKIHAKCALGIYYGVTTEGYLRLAFMSTIQPGNISSTKYIRVTQGKESDEVYWTCFDLINGLTKKVYYTFCEDIASAALNATTESEALKEVENRYYAWKSMFKNKRVMSPESIQGLYGELTFLYKNLIPQFGASSAVEAWGGPDGNSKDFSIGNEWYEIKTTLTSANTIKISSIAQLSAKDPGRLVVCFVEKMASEFEDGMATIFDLVELILLQIETNEVKELFINKLMKYGFDIEDNENKEKFKFSHFNIYKVDDKFPRLREEDIIYPEIIQVSYQLDVHAIDKYKEI